MNSRIPTLAGMADDQALVQRIAVLEELARERFVDDHHRRRRLVVAS
jgi:hypothetical protein